MDHTCTCLCARPIPWPDTPAARQSWARGDTVPSPGKVHNCARCPADKRFVQLFLALFFFCLIRSTAIPIPVRAGEHHAGCAPPLVLRQICPPSRPSSSSPVAAPLSGHPPPPPLLSLLCPWPPWPYSSRPPPFLLLFPASLRALTSHLHCLREAIP